MIGHVDFMKTVTILTRPTECRWGGETVIKGCLLFLLPFCLPVKVGNHSGVKGLGKVGGKVSLLDYMLNVVSCYIVDVRILEVSLMAFSFPQPRATRHRVFGWNIIFFN